ncbi:hypothetical protein SMIF22_02700 [Streptococcus mitis]
MKYKRTQKRSKQMWQRVEKFSIRKFSFGAASCLIGASLVGAAGTVQPVEAALTYEKTGDKTARTLYTNLGDSPDKATGSGVHDVVDVDKEIQINVDWSQYSKTNPYVKVTYKFNGGYGASALYHYGGGRPEFWFTTPIGVKEPRRVTLYNTGTGSQGRVMTSWKGSQGWISWSNSVGSRYQNAEAAKALNAGDPTKWEWYNDTTGESGKTYRGDLDAMFWWRMGDTIAGKPGDQAIYQLFKDNTKSFYADWEKAAHQSVTIEAEYEVVDPTLKNERYTLDFGAGVKVGHGGSLRSRFKVATEQVPALYKNTEFFEPKIPERLGVKNPDSLTDFEKTLVKDRILKANQDNSNDTLPEGKKKFIENLQNGSDGIQIGNDGTATITYSDGSTDVIPGGVLVYKDIDAEEPLDGTDGTYYYHISPYPVADLDNIGNEEEAKGIEKFKEINGIVTNSDGVIQSVRKGVSTNFIGKKLVPYSKLASIPQEGEVPKTKFEYLSILNGDNTRTGVNIPKSALFKKATTLEELQVQQARQKANETIDQLTFLSPKEKEVFKKELEGKTSQEDINSVVNKAISRNSANEKGIAEKKLEVKKGIDALTYLTNAEKEELRKKVDDQGIADPENADGSEGKALDHTKSLLDKILTDATATNLAKAKEKAKEQIEKIKDSLTPEKVEEFKNNIESADSVSKIEEILKEAETLKAKTEAQKAKDEADKLKEDYKKKIDQIPGLSDEDKANYKKQIDEATSKDQLDRILKDAEEKVSREQARTDAKDIIDGLTHLNNAQKTELKEQVAAAGDKAELDRIVNIARDLDSKMDSLQQLVTKADEVKKTEQYTNATEETKTPFDTALTNADEVANKETGKNASSSEVDGLIDKLKEAIKNLTGKEVVVPVSKDALKAEIDESDAIKNSVAYAKEKDDAKKKAYDDALAKAKEVYAKQDATQPEVDDALAKLQEARTALSGKVEDFTLALKNSDAVKISKIPVAGEALSDTDKAIVKDSVTANNEALKQDETVTYGNITEKDGKTYVKVIVTRDGVSKEIEVPVEGTEAAKSPLKDPEKVKVTDPKKLTPEEQTAVKEAVKKANDTLKDNQITVDEQGNVTVTYSDQSQNKLPASKTVEAKTEAEKALDKAKEKAKADLTKAADKEKAEIEADKTLTEDQKKTEKDKVDEAKKTAESNIDKAGTTDEVTTATEAGKKAIDAVHKTNAEQATPTVTGGVVEISVDPNTATNVDSEADKTAIKDAVTVPEGQPQPAKKEILNDGAIKDGKTPGTKVVEVEVTYGDGSKEIIEVPVVKKDQVFTVGVKDPAKPIEIPNTPTVGEDLKDEDKEKIKENLLVNGESLKAGDSVEFGKVTQEQDKTVVSVTVTRDGKSETIKVEVTKKSEPFKLTVTDSTQPVPISKEPVAGDKLTPEDETLVKNKVRVNGEELQANEDVTVGVIANEGGKFVVPVTVTRDGKSETVNVEVTKKSDTTSDQGEQNNQDDQSGSEGQKDKDKATPNVKDSVTEAGGVPVSVDPSNAPKVAEADKKAITDAVEVPKDQPQPTDKQVKNDGEIVEGTGANEGKKVVVVEVTYGDGSKDEIEVPVRKATDKDKAKADLTKAADAEKAEIDEDNALSKKEKEALKKQVDDLKATHEENINNATSPEDIASATEKGRQEIAAVHTPQDITETAKRKLTPPKEKVKVTDINHLTDEEKEAVKKAIVATNPSLEESEVYVSDKGDVASPKGYLEAEKVVVQALNKPTTPVVVADPNHLTNDEKEKVKEAVANANPGLNKDDITVDDKGNVTTKNGDKLLAKDVVTPALKKPTTPVVVGNPNALTEKEKEDIKDAVAAANPGLNKGDVTVNPDGSVTTPKGNLPKEDVVTTVLNKPNKLVEVENPNSLTVKEKEAVKKAVVAANPGLTEDKVKVDDQGNVTTPQGNLPAKDVVTSSLKKPTTPVEVVNPAKLTDPEKAKVVEEIIKNNPDLADKKDKINVDDQGNVETPKGNLPAEDVVTPALKKPTNLVPVKDVHNLTDAEKDAVKDAVVAANPGLNKDDVKVDDQGNVETPRGNLLAGEVVTPALKKPVTPVEVKDPKNLTEAEKDAVKDAIVAANPGLNKDDVKVDGQGNVETPQGNLPAKDVVTPALKKPVTPVGVKDSNNLTDKEKEDVKKAIVEANPGLNKDDVKVDDQGNVETPNGNLPKEDVVVQTAKGQSTSIFKPELDLQTALVSGKATVEKGKDLTDEEILKQLALAEGLIPKVISKPSTTETGTKEAEVEVTLADGTKVTVKVPVEVVDSLGTADKDNDLAKAKEDAKKQVEEAAKDKITEIKKDPSLTEEQKQKAEEAINKAKDEANKAIDEASSAGTAKQIADQAKENIEKYDPKADTEVKKPDVTNLDEEKAKAKAEILEEAQKRIDEIKSNKDLSDEAKQKAIEEINKAKDKAIEDINKGQSKDEINAAKEAGIHKINEVQPDGSIASKFEPKVPENKVEVGNPAKLSDEEREQVRQNIEGANTFPDGTTVEVQPDGTAVITYKDGSSDTISKDKLVAPANKETGTIASRTEPVIPGKTQVGNTTKLTPEEQAAVKKAVEEANNFPVGTTVEVRPDGTVVITYPDKSVDTITGDKLVEKGSKQGTPKVQTDAEKNPAQVPGNFVPVENTHNLTQMEQDTVAAKVKEANPVATDVKVSKDGTATLTYGDGSVNTIPGTSLVVAKDTDNEVATQAAQNPAVVPATTEVGNAHSLTPEEQAAVTAKVQAVNPAATDVKVSKDGTATLTYSDGSVNTIPGTSLVVQKEETSTQEQPTIAEKTKVIIPANPTKVAEATRLTDAEKEAVKKAVVDANGFGSDVKVEVAGDGTATIVFKDGSAITIPGNQLVAQDPKAQDSTKPTAKKSTVKAPAQRVDVKDITHLTDEEKEKVKVAILQANGSALDGATITVAGDGTATITFPDGSVVTILGKDTVQQSAKGKSVTQEATPEYKPETTPGGDNGGNTGSSDANANAGGGSHAGGQANTGSQNPSQSQASKQLATEKESAKKAIEKAAKDKQDEIKGAPLSDKEKAELLARVEAEKQAALKEIENAKTVEDVKEAETIGVQAIAMVTVPKRPVAPNVAPQATSAPQATAGTMQDVTYQSPAGKQLPNTGSASSAALASLGLVAATSGFALLGRKARRRK